MLIMACLVLPATPGYANTDYKTGQKKYPIPDHGELIVNVPDNWEVSYISLALNKPAIITFYEKNDDGRENFQLNLSVLWDDGFIRDITAPDHIRSMVEDSGKALLQYSAESELGLIPLDGDDGAGYYFELSDPRPRIDEFKYLLQGALSVGEVVVIFSLFTNEQAAMEKEKTLVMVSTAKHEYQRHVESHHTRQTRGDSSLE